MEGRKRTFYVAYSCTTLLGEQHIGALDVDVYGPLNHAAVTTMTALVANRVGVEPSQLVITFYDELET